MFVQKANPYHDPKTGRFTHAPASARAAASASTPYGSAYTPARFSILNEDGSLNVENASMLAREFQKPPPSGSPRTRGDQLQEQAYRAQGFDGKPHIVDDATFSSLSGETYYRGDGKPEYSEAIRTGAHRAGFGTYGNGTYATKDSALAKTYGNHLSEEKGGIISFKLHPDARITTTTMDAREPLALENLAGKVVDGLTKAERDGSLSWDQLSTLRNAFMDYGRLAASLGFDAYQVGQYGGVIVVLNRTAMIVSDRDVTDFSIGK